MEVREYWKKIRAIAAKFDPDALQRDREEDEPVERTHLRRSIMPVWLMSIDNHATGSVAGSVVLMKPYSAAERIYAQTHREATPQEIKAYESMHVERREQILAEDLAAKSKVTTHTHVTVDSGEIAEKVAASLSASRKPMRGERADQPVGQPA